MASQVRVVLKALRDPKVTLVVLPVLLVPLALPVQLVLSVSLVLLVLSARRVLLV